MTDGAAGDPDGAAGEGPAGSLEDRVAELEELLGDLASGTARELDDLKDAVLELAGGGAASADAGEGGPARPWAARATGEDWTELARWVDWLAVTYDLQPSRAVLPCWPAHGGAVHELAALHTAWVAAATTDAGDDPGDAMALWHERSLRPTLARLREDYQLKLCTDRHNDPRPARPTDPGLLATALAGAATAPEHPDEDDSSDG